MMKMRRGMMAAGLVLAVSSAGCAVQQVETIPVQHGRVVGDGMVIEAQDGSFELLGGETFRPPFQVDSYELRGPKGGSALAAAFTYDLAGRASGGDWHAGNIGSKSQDALEIGARRVRVSVPGLEQPLYGVLLLSEGPEDSSAPAWRSYEVRVPGNYVDAAVGGVSVVYELGPIPSGGDWFSWILWLSDTPFPA